MKVFVRDFTLQGKVKYEDPRVIALRDKFSSTDTVFYSVEFLLDNPAKAECFLIPASAKLDYIVEDLDKLERNLYSAADKKEVLERAIQLLEKEQFLNEGGFTPEEQLLLRNLNLFTIKPGALRSTPIADDKEIQVVLKDLLDRSGRIFYFTAGKKDSHAWDVYKGTNIVEAAGRIHSDLKRGFIRAEIYNVKDLALFGTFQEAKAKGLVKNVDKAYTVEDGDVLDIKFSV